jgi:small subunit ribosomal protein S15
MAKAKTTKEKKQEHKELHALPESKQEIIETFAQKAGDTGSPEVQVALLTYKIQKLTSHLEGNKKDNHSRRGLLKVIAKRRRILNYLLKLDDKRYKVLIEKLGLKK